MLNIFFTILSRKSNINSSPTQLVSIYYNSTTEEFEFKDGSFDPNASARAAFIPNLNQTGWGELLVETGVGTEDWIASRAAGYAEARLTSHLFESHYKHVISNLCSHIKCENDDLPQSIYDYLNTLYSNVESTTEFGGDFNVGKLLIGQIEGLYHGYLLTASTLITFQQFWGYLCQSIIYDYARNQNLTTDSDPPPLLRRGSAFISWSPDLANVFFGHNSWRPYNEMQRISKRYRFRYSDSNIIGKRRSFSSAPLLPFSDDCFTITDHNKILMSTFIGSSNSAIASVNASEGLSTALPHWYRAIIGLLVSHSAPDFYSIFSPNRTALSGVQYIYADIQKTNYKQSFYDDFVWFIEEGSGLNTTKGMDMTSYINTESYVASFDIPVTREIYESSGYEELAEKEPEMFKFSGSARDLLFNFYAPQVSKEKGAERLIGKNNPKSPEGIQEKSTIYAIAGRYDLDTDNPGCWGAYDAKFTTIQRALHLMWKGRNGPTNDELPSFNFSGTQACKGVDFDGLPDEFNFEWSDHYFDIAY